MTQHTDSRCEALRFSRLDPTAPVPPRKSRRRAKALVLTLASVGVVAAGAGTWGAAGWTRRSDRSSDIDTFTVTRRSFSIELKEKGELKAANSVDVKCKVEGRSTIISIIDEGAAVEEGDLLVELASDQLDTRIRQEELKEATAVTAFEAAKSDLDIQIDKNASDIRKGKLQVELKKLALDKYRKGEWGQKLRDADIAIDEAKMTLDRRHEDFKAAEQLLEKGFMTQTEFEEDRFQYQKAQWNLEKANTAKEVLQTYTHVAESRQRESDHAEAIKELERIKKNAAAEKAKKTRHLEGKETELEITRAELAKLREQKENCTIEAPATGFVVYYSEPWRWGSDDSIKEGSTVRERQILMQLPDTSEMQVLVRIHEAKTDKISVGQPVVAELEGVPGKQFTGKVTKIAVVADTQNRWLNPDLREYETEITLDPTDVKLKPGVTAHVRILVEEVVDQLAVPVQAVYTKAGRRYIFSADGPTIEPREVQLAGVGTEWAALSEGVAEGNTVLLAFTDEHARLIPDLPAAGSNGFKPNGAPDGSQHASKPSKEAGERPKGGKDKGGKDKGGGKRVKRSGAVKAP